MNRLKIAYYPNGESGAVRDRLSELDRVRPEAAAKLHRDVYVLADAGIRSGQISVRSMGGGLWELKRLFEGIHYRILFCIGGGQVWLLHMFEKRSAKTPRRDLDLARRRMRSVDGWIGSV